MKTKSFIKQRGQARQQRPWHNQCGQVSRVILILAGVVLLIAIIVFVAIKIAGSKKSEEAPKNDTSAENKEPPKPVYETTIGDIKFTLQDSRNLGSVLGDTNTYNYLTTTDKFIQVKISAQNKSKNQTAQYGWDLGNMIDSEGRIFAPITNQAYYFLPKPDLCGASLKPEFTPTPCVRMYEVSKKSTGLKVEVINKSLKEGKALLNLYL